MTTEQLVNHRINMHDILCFIDETTYVNADYFQAEHWMKLARGWTGKLKGAIAGTQSPYEVVDEVSKIPPTADTGNGKAMLSGDELTKVNWFREEIQILHDVFNAATFKEEYAKYCQDRIIECLANAKMMFGYVLSDMRKGEVGA